MKSFKCLIYEVRIVKQQASQYSSLSGKWTLLPERVVRLGDDVEGVVIGAGGADEGAGAVLTAGGGSMSVSRYAGFKRSMLTVCSFPWMKIVKCLVWRRRILNGPVYGGSSGLRTASVRTKTWVQVWRSFGTCDVVI